MRNILSNDSKIVDLMYKLGDLVLLNICYLLCCIPIITVGAASAARYAVCFRLGSKREQHNIKDFFQAFRDNLRQGILLWLIVLAANGLGIFAFLLVFQLSGGLRYAYIPFLILLVILAVVSSYIFPLQSQFDNRIFTTIKNAAILSIGYLPRSLCIATLNLLPLLVFLLRPDLFLWAIWIWAGLYFSASAYLNSLLMRKVFSPYLPVSEASQD